MKLKQFKYVPMVLILLFLMGCSTIEDSISKEEAKQLVMDKHTKANRTTSVLSIEVKNNAYYVKWEDKNSKEYGIDKVTKDGEVEMVEENIPMID